MDGGYVIPFNNYTSAPLHTNSSRLTTLADLTTLNDASILSISAYSILLFFGLLGNLVVFFTLLKSRYRKSSRVNKLILHLAVADLLVCCFTIPIEIGWRVTGIWQAGDAGCRILQFTRPFGLYLSSNTIICISLDRYFAIIQPLKLADARRRGRFMLGCAWLFAVICSVPQVGLLFLVVSAERPGFLRSYVLAVSCCFWRKTFITRPEMFLSGILQSALNHASQTHLRDYDKRRNLE